MRQQQEEKQSPGNKGKKKIIPDKYLNSDSCKNSASLLKIRKFLGGDGSLISRLCWKNLSNATRIVLH